MQIYIFSKAAAPKLKRAILAAGGEEISEELFRALKIFLGKEKTIHIRAHALSEQKEFPRDTLKYVLSRPTSDLSLSIRTRNILRSHLYHPGENFSSISQVVLIGEVALSMIKGCGRKVQLEIKNALRSLGLDFIDCLSNEERRQVEEIESQKS